MSFQKHFFKNIVIENRTFSIFIVEDICQVETKEDEIYVWLKGYKPDFYFKAKHFSEEFFEIDGIGDNFQANSEDSIENKDFWIQSAIDDISFWLGQAILEENYYEEFEEHF